MPYAVGILTHTPWWVFLLFAYLVWQGIRALRPRTQPLWRLLIVPSIFIVWGLSRLVTRHDETVWPLLAWLVGALLSAPVAFATFPTLLAVDRDNGQVTRAGSPIPLVRNVTVFALQYAVAVAAALQAEGHTAMAVIGQAVSGATAGYFVGWAMALWRRYRNANDRPRG